MARLLYHRHGVVPYDRTRANRESPGGVIALVSHTDAWCSLFYTRDFTSSHPPEVRVSYGIAHHSHPPQ